MKLNKEQKPKLDKRKLAVRIIAWILILMTVVTALYTAIYFIVMSVNAAETANKEISVAVGLLYGANADVALTARTPNGFTVGSEVMGKYEKTFKELWSLPGITRITALCDTNYAKVGDGYRLGVTPDVGAYRIDVGMQMSGRDTAEAEYKKITAALEGSQYYAVPAYINGTYRIRVGSFLSSNDANGAISEVQARLPGYSLSVKSPSATGTYLIDHASKKALFEYDFGKTEFLAVDAIDNKDGTEAYLTMYNNNLYDGVFVFKRNTVSGTERIEVITVAPLERYVMGVITEEISNSWPLETQKAFAILARTFIVNSMGNHWSEGFNICATANCQVYGGAGRVNDTVREAVNSTKGLVTTYDGKLAAMYYSSSTGDCTADVNDVWVADLPWLHGVETPWEDYLHHANAFWTAEVSPSDLCKYLNSKGYTKLRDSVADIRIDETSNDVSTYVCSITITDIYGNSVVIKKCQDVQLKLSKYVKSANFVVGKGLVEYTTYTKTVPPSKTVHAVTAAAPNSLFSIITGSGTDTFEFNGVKVVTGSGTYDYTPSGSMNIATSSGIVSADTVTDVQPGDGHDEYIVKNTMKASSPDNFIFVGKGWGHGVGLSQWGLYDLAKMNVDYLSMIRAYCPGVSVSDYKQYVKW